MISRLNIYQGKKIRLRIHYRDDDRIRRTLNNEKKKSTLISRLKLSCIRYGLHLYGLVLTQKIKRRRHRNFSPGLKFLKRKV